MKILLILSSILLNSVAQLCIRKVMLMVGNVGVSNITQSLVQMVTNQSLGFVVVAVAGYFLFNENVSLLRIVGILVICIGVYLISRS